MHSFDLHNGAQEQEFYDFRCRPFKSLQGFQSQYIEVNFYLQLTFPYKNYTNFVLFLLKEVKVSIIYNGKRVRKAALIIGFAKYSISQIISLSFSFFSTYSVSF